MASKTGIPELQKAFLNLSKEVEKKQKTAVKLVANEYKNDVQQIAPYKTGTLRRSIHVEMQDDVALVGTNLEYARRLEYGFADTDPKGRVYNQSAQPYFRPPLDQNQKKYNEIFKEALFK